MVIELSVEEILGKMNQLPERFNRAYAEEKWAMAASTYVTAVDMSHAMGMDPAERMEYLYRFNQGKVEDAFGKAGWTEEGQDEEYKRVGAVAVQPTAHVPASYVPEGLSVGSIVRGSCPNSSVIRRTG